MNARTSTILVALYCAVMSVGLSASIADADVLAEVNGVPITSADLESMIVEYHQTRAMSVADAEGLIPRLLEKAIRDELILQDAFSMGMGDDPSITQPIRAQAIRKAISLYARDQIHLDPITDEQVQEFFTDYYHKIKLRKLSLGTPEEAMDALRRVREGEVAMGTLATEVSLDSKKSRGGLHNDMYWADVDTVLRQASEGLGVGEYSDVFKYGGVWSFVRVESRTPPDPTDLPRFEGFIRGVLRAEQQAAAWAAFVAEGRRDLEVTADDAVLARVREDEEFLYRGEFKFGSNEPLLILDPAHVVTEKEFRSALSTMAMSMGESSFDEVLGATIEEKEEFLILWRLAERDGWLEDPEVIGFYEDELERVVLNLYLEENIAQKVRLNREEYAQFYVDHQEDFRGPEEVRLSMLTADDETTIRDAAERLGQGADFEYLRAEIEGRDPETLVTPNWGPITGFSDAIIGALSGLQVGATTEPLPYGNAWMIIRLDGRREGQVRSIEEVDGAIRQALYVKEFSELLDEHLARLSEASEIVRYEDRIQEWAEGD